jgi:poly(3-hydroxybutyrate) depolymerase
VAFRSFAIGAVEGRKDLCSVAEHAVGSFRFGVLRGFCRSRAARRRLLVVAPLAGGYPLLLRDLVVALLRELDEVVITDWPDSRYVPKSVGAFGLSDNILHVEAMIRKLGPGLHVLGVCQGVVPALAATALLAAAGSEAAPSSLTLVGGPVDPMASPSRLVRLLRERPLAWFEENMIEEVDDAYPGRGRRIYSRSHQLETFSAYALRHMVEKRELFWKSLFDDGEDPVRFPFASLCWNLMDIPAELLLDMVRDVFQRDCLAKGHLFAGGRRVELRAIEGTALATIEGDEDDISPPGQTSAAHALCPGIRLRRKLTVPGSGHFSLFHGSKTRNIVVPAILELMGAASRGTIHIGPTGPSPGYFARKEFLDGSRHGAKHGEHNRNLSSCRRLGPRERTAPGAGCHA